MTCLAVLADIHGNLPALEAVLAEIQQKGVDGVIVAGDLTGGPHPDETIELLRELGSWMIRGNSDSQLLQLARGAAPAAWYTSRQFALLRWSARHIDPATLSFLESLPQQRVVEIAGAPAIRVVHGSPRHAAESIFPDQQPEILDLALAQVGEPALVCGHTHIPWVRERDGRLALNPGAVCGPLSGDVGAQYALLAWREGPGASRAERRWRVEHCTAAYDLARIRADFCASGLLEQGGALARAFLRSIETAQNVALDFLCFAYELAARKGFAGCDVVPDDVWNEAELTFDWNR